MRLLRLQAMRTIYDEYNDEDVVLSKDELRMIMAIRKGHFPHVEINPYEPYVDWCVPACVRECVYVRVCACACVSLCVCVCDCI
jgi:hypothetical protein